MAMAASPSSVATGADPAVVATDDRAALTANDTISASGHTAVFAGSGPLQFIGGASVVAVLGSTAIEASDGGSGGMLFRIWSDADATVSAVGAPVAMFGTAGLNTFLAGPDGSGLGAGNSAPGDGARNNGPPTIAGSASDTLVAGAVAGTTSLLGDGTDLFSFFQEAGGGSADLTVTFTSAASLLAARTGGSEPSVPEGPASVGSSVTLTLSDNTTITLSDLTRASPSQGPIVFR